MADKPLSNDLAKLNSLDEGYGAKWRVGDMIDPLPENAKYQKCWLRMDTANKKDFEQLVMMGDVQHLLLLKCDFSNKDHVKGTLIFKCPYRAILHLETNSKEKKYLDIEII